jgi:hypothetical protein
MDGWIDGSMITPPPATAPDWLACTPWCPMSTNRSESWAGDSDRGGLLAQSGENLVFGRACCRRCRRCGASARARKEPGRAAKSCEELCGAGVVEGRECIVICKFGEMHPKGEVKGVDKMKRSREPCCVPMARQNSTTQHNIPQRGPIHRCVETEPIRPHETPPAVALIGTQNIHLK